MSLLKRGKVAASCFLVAMGVSGLAVTANASTIRTPVAVSLSGDAQDVVVEAGATAGTNPNVYTSAVTDTFDGGSNVFYEAGLANSPTYNGHPTGLPASGNFVSEMDGTTTFQLQPYTTNNVLLGDNNLETGTLTLATPAKYSSLAVLAAGGGGTAGLQATLNFQDGTKVQTDIGAPDWFGGSTGTTADGNSYAIAIQGFNRVDDQSGTFDTAYPSNPKFFQTDLNLTNLNGYVNGSGTLSTGLDLTGKVISSITFQRVDNSAAGVIGRPGVFALSGAAAAPEPSSAFLLLGGIGGLILLGQRRRRMI